MIRGVLFDAAGTLIELREPVGETYARVAARRGLRIPARRLDDAFRRVLGSAPPLVFPDADPAEIPELERAWWRDVVRSTFLAADSSRRPPDADACFDELWRLFSGSDTWAPREGAIALLEGLRARRLRMAVVSNFDLRLPGLLDALGLGRLLDAVLLPSEARVAKPEPAIFRAALARLGLAPGEALFVGDDARRDLEGARAVGLMALDVGSLATLDALRILGDESA